MSATNVREPNSAKNIPNSLSIHQLNPSYTVRVICCVLFIFLTEIFLAHYIYRLMNSEVQQEYVAKTNFKQFFFNEIKNEHFRDEVKNILSQNFFLQMKTEPFREELKRLIAEFVSLNESSRQKRSVKHGGDFNNYLQAQAEEPQVEFFNPKMRENLEEKDEEIMRKTGNKGAAPGGDSWIWVTSSSRIPEKALEGYCQKVQEFCPKAPGPQGPPGLKGEVGDRGYPGLPGAPGYPGEKGEPGRAGLDGRDGLPGEPGLYGMPGRNGHDGLPGKDGIPGKDGKDGINGLKGDRGPQGPQGPIGPRGIMGQRGRTGKPGNHGQPGIPGIIAWKIIEPDKDNLNVTKYLIAPSIAGAQAGPMGPIVVHEGENVRLHCSATGTPVPKITWQKVDRRPINRGAWQDIQVTAETLNLTRVNRDHAGTYMCIADNGVPPQANQTFNVEVYFPPLIRIFNQKVGVSNGSTALLECETEAFPDPVRFWERDDGGILENGTKYKMLVLERHGYKSRMQLHINRITSEDKTHRYYCVSKNELQKTVGEIQLFEIDPKNPPPPVQYEKDKVFGPLPPEKVSLEDLCGPAITCPDCECSSSGDSLVDLITKWEVKPFQENITYPGYANRIKDCVLYAVGKPVYHRYIDHNYGCWMRDSNPPSPVDQNEHKIWVTYDDQINVLYEFDNKTSFKRNVPDKKYMLDHPFGGNTHVIYNGYFFYNVKDTRRIIRYNLMNESSASLDLPIHSNNQTRLYEGGHNTVDFSVDDNGLWVIFAVPDSNNTAVMKVNTETVKAQYVWNISLDHHKVGEMFIVCGVLYAVDSATERNTKIRFAFDLYKKTLLDVNLSFTNPFRKTTMLGYNPRNQELYSWDRGNQLTYPVRYHDVGYNSTGKDEKSEMADNRR